MPRIFTRRFWYLFFALFPLLAGSPAYGQAASEDRQVLFLNDCLRIAMEKNHARPASQYAVAIAEAQHRQALAAYWPQVSANGGVTQMDQAPNFLFPATTMYIPSESIAVPGGTATVTIPANAFGPGFPRVALQMPVSFPGQKITTASQMFPIPSQDIKLLNPTTESVQGEVSWLLLDGGLRRGYREQSLGGLDAARAEAHRTDLEVADSVIRLYYGAVLARQLRQLGQDTLERMESTLKVTETLYQDGSGTVNKTDFLDNKVMVETVRSMVAPLEKNEAAAEAALAYTIGLSWRSSVIPGDQEIPFHAYAGNLDDLVSSSYEFNPDWAKLDAGLRALEGERLAASSGHYPKLGLKGELHRFWNSYDGGIATPQNKAGWTVDLGIEIPIFDGFLTSAKVAEARARINQLKEQKLMLREGLGLQIRDLFLGLAAANKVFQATGDAQIAAKDDSDLTLRAYETGLVATEKVIRVQLQEALVSAAHDKAIYDYLEVQSRINLVVGKSVQSELIPGQ
jgi:outer membrane protein TolC